jgi:hypothetical protein
MNKFKTPESLADFWQVPFDGDTERVVRFTFTTAKARLPTNGAMAPYGTTQAPTFSFAQAKGSTDGPNRDNCITVSFIPSVTFVSGQSGTQITIKGLKGTPTSDSDAMTLYADKNCGTPFTDLAGSNGATTKAFMPVSGTNKAHGEPEAVRNNFRPMGKMVFNSGGTAVVKTTPATDTRFALEDVDWHTRARSGTISALTKGGYNKDRTESTLTQVPDFPAKLTTPTGDVRAGNGKGKFSKADGTLTVAITPGYYLQAGELLSFSFKLQNPADVQDSQALTVSASGTYCDSTNTFCSGATDPKLEITDFPIVGKGKILETKKPYFETSKIFQASSDPDSLTTIFVTLATNVDLKKPDSTSDARLTITGLCGFQTGSNVLLYQNQKAGGLPLNNDYPTEAIRSKNDLPGLPNNDDKHVSRAFFCFGKCV